MTKRELGDISSLRLLKTLLTLDLSEDLRNKYADYLMDNPALSEHDVDFEEYVRDFVKNTTFIRIVFASEIRQGAPCYEIFIPLTKEQLNMKVSDYAFECRCALEEVKSFDIECIITEDNDLTTDEVSLLLASCLTVKEWLNEIDVMPLIKTIAGDIIVAEIKDIWPVEFLELLRTEISKTTK